ncbi:sensor histidine kinase [Deinococcus aerophilus]|uniref:Two-component sensor histidine kinase n=1 Tax=Deinococcus aerophilus TaxID=522488 RepID=A0ABQ2GUX2_9DEIO|nr:histidine kinase [Deinococcus aerophilus]GGM14594.1 two-component sensor histidine kinase [Deinococcus aerophilus]
MTELRRGMGWTGILLWTALAANSLLAPPSREGLTPEELLPWGAAMLGFLAAFLTVTVVQDRPRWRRRALQLVALESVLALQANQLLDGNSVLAGLLLLTAAQVGILVPVRWALVWVGAQTVALLSVFLSYWSVSDAWSYGTGYLCFQLFAVTTGQTAVREIQARQQLAAVVAELRATRALLGQASRQAERLQISRELHDLMGHHLTALGMNLQVALHRDLPGAARPPVEQAAELARMLLGDVRAAVRGMRETATCDVRAEIEALSQTVSVPVHLTFPSGFSVPCPVQSQVLLRTVQEILTNALRHAGARQVWLTFGGGPDSSGARQLTLHARDDGHVARHFTPGCGLTGMRERLESVGGSLEVRVRPGEPLELFARLPLPGSSPHATVPHATGGAP